MSKEIDEFLELRLESEVERGCGGFRQEDVAYPRRSGGLR